MPTNDERIRFLDRFQLSITWHENVATIFWRGRDLPGQPGGYYEVSKGATLAEATDAAIGRWEKKHGKQGSPRRAAVNPEGPESSNGVQWLQVRGWVS